MPRSDNPSHTSLENAYVGWRSGDTFALGKDFLDISVGMQPYQAGTGFEHDTLGVEIKTQSDGSGLYTLYCLKE